MTQLQEVRWVDEAVAKDRLSKPIEKQVFHNKIDLLRDSWTRRLLISRWLQFALRSGTLLGLIFTILVAFSGTVVGSHNFAIIIVWIAWWTVLKLVFIPLGGRSWCSICPIPLAGDWLQQGGIFEKLKPTHGLNLRWPKALRGTWLQSGNFLLIGLFSAVILTDPHVTGWVLVSLFVLATGISLIFEHRAFCSHLCPIGGFSGIYAKAAPVELRVVDKTICVDHQEKSCYQACPWGIYPLTLRDSSACGLCLDCVRACPKDNLALNLRPFGTDLIREKRSVRLDEAFLALVMLGSALTFSAVFIGPWGWLKSAAHDVGSLRWVVYGTAFLALTILIIPSLFALCLWLWKKINRINVSWQEITAVTSPGLLPLGLLAWIAFTLSFALPKLNLILGVINDPLGWGWHLLSLTNTIPSPEVLKYVPYLQASVLVLGAFWAARVTVNNTKIYGKERAFPNLALLAFILVYSSILLWLLLG